MKEKKWELKLKEARELRKRSSETLFDRVVLLVGCYQDDEFRLWCEENGTSDLDQLDEELSDVSATFLTLKAVLDEHPDRESWVKHNIRELIAMVIDRQREAKKREGESTRQSWKERALVAEAECEKLRAELQNMKEALGIVSGAKCR